MAKKSSGLGRSLGELLDDNTPQVRNGKGSASLRQGEETIRIAATPQKENPQVEPKGLFDETKHKNRSVIANFKKFK